PDGDGVVLAVPLDVCEQLVELPALRPSTQPIFRKAVFHIVGIEKDEFVDRVACSVAERLGALKFVRELAVSSLRLCKFGLEPSDVITQGFAYRDKGSRWPMNAGTSRPLRLGLWVRVPF